ncbi:MAG TPA: winged helix-turn-helix transcriptional regulator, partial [Nitrososphaera sp.]|nr:winged helix-turn-helix transcriptional regulator [Nitrososphaera sp.]
MTAQRPRNNKTNNQAIAASAPVDHRLLDDLNIKIVRELVKNPDASSTEIAEKYDIPLSTIQRR